MKYLWLFWLPLLFLPDLGFQHKTLLGTLSISDFLIGPYLVMVYPISRNKGKLFVDRLTPSMIAFVWWATISTLLINLRYGYSDNFNLYFGLLKLGKLSLYGTAGILTIRALADEDMRLWFNWSLLMAGVLVAINLLISRQDAVQWYTLDSLIQQMYQDNIINALMACLICYIFGLLLIRYGSRKWRWLAGLGLLLMLTGFLLSRGRGGWLAALAGTIYLFYRSRFQRTLVYGLIGIGMVFAAYLQFPTFQSQVDKTLWPDQRFIEQHPYSVVAGIDDGVRTHIWVNEGRKVVNAPIIGTGFYHRSDKSELLWTGSHNFFIQMFLETGFVGGGIILGIFLNVWLQAGSEVAKASMLDIPVKSALIAAFVAGMSGEYFYGGMVLFTFLIIYGTVGSLTVPQPDGIPSFPQQKQIQLLK